MYRSCFAEPRGSRASSSTFYFPRSALPPPLRFPGVHYRPPTFCQNCDVKVLAKLRRQGFAKTATSRFWQTATSRFCKNNCDVKVSKTATHNKCDVKVLKTTATSRFSKLRRTNTATSRFWLRRGFAKTATSHYSATWTLRVIKFDRRESR